MNYELYDSLNAQRKALVGLHARLQNLTTGEYNALIKAVWRIDRQMLELRQQEISEMEKKQNA